MPSIPTNVVQRVQITTKGEGLSAVEGKEGAASLRAEHLLVGLGI